MGGVQNQSTIKHDGYNDYNLLLFNIDLCGAGFKDQSIYEKCISFFVNNIFNCEVRKKIINFLLIFSKIL